MPPVTLSPLAYATIIDCGYRINQTRATQTVDGNWIIDLTSSKTSSA